VRFSGLAGLLFFAVSPGLFADDTLGETLRAAQVPLARFAAAELAAKITSYAESNNPYLLAYHLYDDPATHVIRYDRTARSLRRADVHGVKAMFQGTVPMDCDGSVLNIREQRGTIYMETHTNPSAGCVVVLSPDLTVQTALSGWVLGLLAADYAILRASEIHFMAVHPMHLEAYDVKRNQTAEVFPYPNDPERDRFSRLLAAHKSEQWCMEHNAPCDEKMFEIDLKGNLVVNENAKTFGFEATFSATGFGDAAEKNVPPQSVVYVFRERGGTWEHRAIPSAQFKSRFGGASLQELIAKTPDRAF
jgi:hypothetical protein